MKIDPDCIECIIGQSKRVADAINANELLREEILFNAIEMSKKFSFDQSPPEVATPLYEKMAEIAGKKDLYDEVKRRSTLKALALVPLLQNKIKDSTSALFTATKIAVAGNVIDLAAEVEFDLDEELEKIFHTEFVINDFPFLKKRLAESSSLLYIADNAGEHIFDKVYIQTIKELYPQLDITYMTRGTAIINDVTYEEAQEAGFEALCNLVSSGVNTPGFIYSRANERSQKLFDEADVIITKGMGNYECLSESSRKNLFFLLKIKCNVVARSLNRSLGDIICKQA